MKKSWERSISQIIIYASVFIPLASIADEQGTLDLYEKCLTSIYHIGSDKPELGGMVAGESSARILWDGTLPGYYLFNASGAYRAKVTQPVAPKPYRDPGDMLGSETVSAVLLEGKVPVVANGMTKVLDSYALDKMTPNPATKEMNHSIDGLTSSGEETPTSVQAQGVPVLALNFQNDLDPRYWSRLGSYLAANIDGASFDSDHLFPITLAEYQDRMKDDFAACRATQDPTLVAAIERIKTKLNGKFRTLANQGMAAYADPSATLTNKLLTVTVPKTQ